ncbi:serine/threonine-protein kinase [Mycobacterium vicinigordonae]|uniref:non-specific serine/threonine protein kinase n=1 Tax=Mycobacterium vicinigordonae TaxID=1719132 RepID=A0A7D6E347_9MYCO|nr:serine/threonine-protein kinase [Mycobacterium vicinigordonae]QLL06202.1 serine/threonine protein kinase [Mycobacterium vicinigordonae]
MSQAPDSGAGSMFGPYRFTRLIGRGGMGEVYEAEHTVKGWTVAVKLMSETVSKDPVFRERMKREARIAGRLQEPHVVPIHDYGEINGQMFLEMRLIEGDDLDDMLQRYGPLPPARAIAIITQVASALDAAHALGVTHRDVKPPNILITRDDFAYLVDFGIASAKTEEKLTQLGAPVGTWKYMGPERFSDSEVTLRADVYSLACVLYECLTGTAPYPSDSAGVLISAHMMNPIPRPSAAREGIPQALDAVIARGMAKRPADRYASAGELARAARDALSDPDRDRVSDIVRRSQETALPERFVDPTTVQHPRPPQPPPPRRSGPVQTVPPPSNHPPSGQRPPPPGPRAPLPPQMPAAPTGSAGARPTWAPALVPSGPIPGAPPPAPGSPASAHWAGGTPPGAPVAPPLRGPAPWQPAAPGRNHWAIVAGVAALVLLLIVGAIGIWAATKDDGSAQASGHSTTTTRTTTRTTDSTTAPTTRTPSSSSSAAQARLLSSLPAGYPAGSCKNDDKTMPGALVSVTCGQNTDSNGPRVSAYGLFADLTAVKNAFSGFIGTFTVQQCPGGKASPTTWWHTKDPKTILGQMACGNYQGDPQVMWSNEQTLVFALVSGKPQGPSLDQIFKWWGSHS